MVLDRLGGENAVDLIPLRVLVCPRFDGLEHITLDINTVVSERWMVEGSKHIVDHFVNGHPRVLPCCLYLLVTR